MIRRVWIAWETQRRTLNLSGRLNAELIIFEEDDKGIFRYPISILKTLIVLWKFRGQLVFVQFPSMFLAALSCFLKPLLRYTLVVDRHTDFSMELKPPFGLKEKLILFLSAYTVRKADLTLVTNSEMAAGIEATGGRSFVLPDPYPELPVAPWRSPPTPLEILFVSTWAEDEPIVEVMEASRMLAGEVKVYISGRMKKAFEKAVSTAPSNFIPTGFLSDEKYFELMSRVDGVMAITTRPATLVCGAYEAVSMGKPLILGDSRVLREYFHQGAVYTGGGVHEMENALREFSRRLPVLRDEILRFHAQSLADWGLRLAALNDVLEKDLLS